MNPYPGLRPFVEEDAPYFRGRDAEIEQLLNLLAERRFVLVTGTSGSGKSSLVQAGVIPILRSGLATDLDGEWKIVVLRPSRGPLRQLQELLKCAEPFSKPSDLLLLARQELAPGQRLLIVVDQFEEIFDYRRERLPMDGGNECALFVNLLLAATDQRDTSTSVLLTMRSEYLGECSQFRGLPEALNRGHYLVPRLTRLQQEEAIVGPASSFGERFEPALVQHLLNDSEEDADRLPILQHVLKRLWEQKGSRPQITETDYRDIGGWIEALERDARSVLEQFPDQEHAGVARLFQWITATNQAGQPIRRPRPFDELPAVTGMERSRVADVVRAFAARDMLQIAEEAGGEIGRVDLTHESVISNWPWLKDAVSEEASVAGLASFLKLSQARKTRLTGATLNQAAELLRRMRERPRWAVRHLSAAEQEQIAAWLRRAQWWMWGERVAAIAALLVVIGAIAFFSYSAYGRRVRAQQAAITERRAREALNLGAMNAVKGLEAITAGSRTGSDDTSKKTSRIPQNPVPPPAVQNAKARHLVVLMMENRSFDHMLGGLKSQDARIDGLTGNESNPDPDGQDIKVAPLAAYQGQLDPDPPTTFAAVDLQMFNGLPGEPNMKGFVRSYAKSSGAANAHARVVMNYFAPGKLPVLTTLARQFAVADRWFASVPASSFPNWAFAFMGTSSGRVSTQPVWARSKTIFELLATKGVTGKIYYQDYTPALITPDLAPYISPFSQFLQDCRTGTLASYSYISPRYSDGPNPDGGESLASDQHPDHDVRQGEMLIATIYNAIFSNLALRNGTIFVIVYSNHGGLYDHVPPPRTVSPDGKVSSDGTTPTFDFTRLGVRVPAVIVSPYIEPGTVDHTVYDHTSLIATARKLFLGTGWAANYLTERDRHANTFDHLLTRGSPRSDTPVFNLK